MGAIFLTSQISTGKIIRQEFLQTANREGSFSVNLLETWFMARHADIASWGGQQVFLDALIFPWQNNSAVRQQAGDKLFALLQEAPWTEVLFITDVEGKIRSASEQNPLRHIQPEERQFLNQTIQRQAHTFHLITDLVLGEPAVALATPIFEKHQIIGAISAIIPLGHMRTMLAETLSPLGSFSLILCKDHGEIPVPSAYEPKHTQAAFRQALQKNLSGTSHGSFIHRVEQSTALINYRKLGHNAYFCIVQSWEEIPMILHGTWLRTVLVGLLFLTGCGILTTLLVHSRITSRLQQLASTISSQMQCEPLTSALAQPDHGDEISQLYQEVNAMHRTTHDTLALLKKEVKESRKNKTAFDQCNLAMERELRHHQQLQRDLDKAKRLKMIGTVAGGVAHDLNNILSGVVSYPDLLLMKTEKDSPLHKPLKIIQESGRKASAIVQDLLILTRKVAMEKNELHLNAVIEQYLESPEFLALMGNHKQTVVVTELADDLYPMLGSALYLNKAIMNLVSNAVEAMPHGGRVKISTDNCYIDTSITTLYETVGEGNYVILQISDQGEGIPQKDLAKIFQPFFTSKQMGKSGTGLGMVIVQEAVKDHNGHISCESTVNQGTEFTIFFPALSNVVLKTEMCTKPPESIQGKNEKILVIDDIAEQRKLTTAILEKLGYQVTAAASGEEGIELIQQGNFDLLLLDMILGSGMDGLDTFKEVRTYKPKQKALITSGYSEISRIKEVLRLGAGGYIKKPYIIQELGYAIRQELERPAS